MRSIPELIAKKRDGGQWTAAEIRALIAPALPDYQVSAWLMAVFFRGLSDRETADLTIAMRDSGKVIDLSPLPGVKLDKHSSGGVGDKTTLVLAPLLAAAGLPIAKMSGRGLGFSGGTIDKLESIPGLRTDLSAEAMIEQVRRIGLALVGQSPGLVPADKRLYALRDVTATVESLPLIAASIMSKKLAAGADRVLLDVKVGSGAFLTDLADARELARRMVAIGEAAGKPTRAVLTDMDQPLGRTVGNALEVREAVALLRGDAEGFCPRFRALCLELARRGLDLAEADADPEALLSSGEAFEKFSQMVEAQGGDRRVLDHPARLPEAPVRQEVRAAESGYVRAVDARAIGLAAVALGAGRTEKDAAIDPAVGIVLLRRVGERVTAGDLLAEIHASGPDRAGEGVRAIRAAFRISGQAPPARPLVLSG